ncbi:MULTISPECIES: DUF1259 domain-containing protein [unclassified Bacillus (in: firmicutes)]|uniref:DUF1259 domain-containing protein n=1 Tax=unclassified Bacillus (in: firmicutes) TaxID=185979 RepID=UPI001BE7D207|nr:MULTISPECIES: DUF1259 domain-containing protein [unclassified Bacillus (in: firmicutes)]MBT2637636.1 DUF1259 domain-containing protein [Bacillus sp. ISL-39]MBT2662068.1 DUF1259 domain-containing protein [Bacillus sp. ISL-45]
MKRLLMVSTLVFALFLAGAVQAQGNANCKKLEKTFNTNVETENGVCKVEIVRENINPTHMGKKLSPETMELVFHFGFEKVDGQVAVMGELALMQEEVNPVLDELRKGKLEVTAVHNHMMHEEPRIMYVHFQGIGDMEQQAKTIKAAIDKTSK